jgi:hypothetical protein
MTVLWSVNTTNGWNIHHNCFYVIKSRLNDLNYIVNTPTRRKKRQICQVTTHGFSQKYKLTVDASDAGVGAILL